MGSANDYFSKKKPWSLIKDALLESYLPPYLAKLSMKGKEIYIIDCFAGKGKFDDGNEGSPLIIAKAVEKARQRRSNVRIKPIFIEMKYGADLKANLSAYPDCTIICGKFEDQYNRFQEICRRSTVLLYIDPYGIKSLDSVFFKELLDISERAKTSFEMLLNLNTFGFLREACRLIKPTTMLSEFDDNDVFYEGHIESKRNMDRIAGGNFWRKLVSDYYSEKVNFAQMERDFTYSYLERLSKRMGWDGFRYVFNTPIKDKSKNIAKYRMIFGTNHIDGAILMADNMNKRWNTFLDSDFAAKYSLFKATTEGKIFDWKDVDNVILSALKNDSKKRIENIFVEVWEEFGIAISKKEIENRISSLYEKGTISLAWDPPRTPTGKKPRSLNYRKYKIELSISSGNR